MTHSSQSDTASDTRVVLGIALIVGVFAIATISGWTSPGGSHPDASAAATHSTAHSTVESNESTHDRHDQPSAESHGDDKAEPHGDQETEAHGGRATDSHGEIPGYYAVMPFAVLLGAIAILPLLRSTEHWWESNLHRFWVAAGMASLTIIYYLLLDKNGGWPKVGHVLDHAILGEYIPFIVLLFSLYTISGGIRIEGDLPAHPMTNVAFLLVGGLLASFIGTTGAAMLLIRPLLETNRERKHIQHTVVFFIFVVCNCGGCLLPIGDPPLFLGYLAGVEFLWTMWHLWLPWLVINAILIVIYYVWDRFFCYPHETPVDIRRDETRTRPMRISGLWPNVLLLLGIIASVALLDSKKTLPGTDWHPWLYFREAVQLSLVAVSLWFGSTTLRQANRFNYHAIVEVAVLFVGIFICMQPALEILNVQGPQLGIDTPAKFFWSTGSLSAVLDNAPTYVVFFNTASALFSGDFATMVSGTGGQDIVAREMLVGISLGAVFMGAMTYIGNGPNFMVRAIAEQSGIRMPSFFGYVIFYSAPVLIPVFVLTTLFFLI